MAQPVNLPDRPVADSPKVQAHIRAARRNAQTQWKSVADYFCSSDRPVNQAGDPVLSRPQKLFDDLYMIGQTGTVVYALNTLEGIILIDSGYADRVESLLIPALRQVALDPAMVKYIIVTHGHADHYGGARYFQEHFSTHVVMSKDDWDLIAKVPAISGGGAVVPPEHDLDAVEGTPIALGDVSVIPYAIPGHTPGSIGLIFPVKDAGKEHVAGLFGGTILLTGRISNEGLTQYVASLDHFAKAAQIHHVDVELQNHPLFDNTFVKVLDLNDRKVGQQNPFIVGTSAYQRFLTVMSECIQAEIARRLP